jgi:hypothetical protein
MLFLAFLVLFADASERMCKSPPHTVAYLKHGPHNLNNYFFVPETFGPLLTDRCTAIDINTDYRNKVESSVRCSGQWCSGNTFSCIFGGNCYQVEHIIDKENSDPALAGCSTNIYGNLVMAYGDWNQQVGRLCWDQVVDEKGTVYGSIFTQARENVKYCCSSSFSDWLAYFIQTWFLYYILPIGLILLCVLFVICGVARYRENKNKTDVGNTPYAGGEGLEIEKDRLSDSDSSETEMISVDAFDPGHESPVDTEGEQERGATD